MRLAIMAIAALGAIAASTVQSATDTATTSRTPSAQRPTPSGDITAGLLIGTAVDDGQGHRIGQLKDLVVETSQGYVRYAVLSFGGFLGLGDKLFAYPLRAFRFGDGDTLTLAVDRASLRASPGFDPDRWPGWSDGYYDLVDRLFGRPRDVPPNTLARATELIGRAVDDRNGREVGRIEDLMIDMHTADVRYAIIELDRDAPSSERRVAYPIQRLHASGSAFAMDIARDDVASLPGVGSDGRVRRSAG